MTAWWNELSARERSLLLTAAALAAILVVSFGVLRPLGDWRRGAEARVDRARASLETVVAAAGSAAGPAAAENSTPLRQAITMTAQIEIIRLGAELDGQIEVQSAPVDGETLFAWLNALSDQYDVDVRFADIVRSDDGRVEAQILVFSRSGQ